MKFSQVLLFITFLIVIYLICKQFRFRGGAGDGIKEITRRASNVHLPPDYDVSVRHTSLTVGGGTSDIQIGGKYNKRCLLLGETHLKKDVGLPLLDSERLRDYVKDEERNVNDTSFNTLVQYLFYLNNNEICTDVFIENSVERGQLTPGMVGDLGILTTTFNTCLNMNLEDVESCRTILPYLRIHRYDIRLGVMMNLPMDYSVSKEWLARSFFMNVESYLRNTGVNNLAQIFSDESWEQIFYVNSDYGPQSPIEDLELAMKYYPINDEARTLSNMKRIQKIMLSERVGVDEEMRRIHYNVFMALSLMLVLLKKEYNKSEIKVNDDLSIVINALINIFINQLKEDEPTPHKSVGLSMLLKIYLTDAYTIMRIFHTDWKHPDHQDIKCRNKPEVVIAITGHGHTKVVKTILQQFPETKTFDIPVEKGTIMLPSAPLLIESTRPQGRGEPQRLDRPAPGPAAPAAPDEDDE